MDYNFSWPKVQIESRLMVQRVIALIGVLRELTDSVPDDAVLLYLYNVDCSGLRDCILRNVYYNPSMFGENGNRTPVKSMPSPKLVIPDALRKMADNYFFSVLHEEIRHPNRYSDKQLDDDPAFRINTWVTAYPKAVRDALDVARLTSYATLDDHKAVIDTLRASVCTAATSLASRVNSMRDRWCSTYSYKVSEYEWKRQGFDILTGSQEDKIRLLYDMYFRAIDKLMLDKKIPNPYVWSTFCNLMEILVLLKSPLGFAQTASLYTVYEYSKMAEVGHQRIVMLDNETYATRSKDHYGCVVDEGVKICSKLSPKAVLMLGRNARLDFISYSTGIFQSADYSSYMFEKFINEHNRTTSTPVSLFVKYELAIQRSKLRAIKSAIDKQRKHGQTQYNWREGQCDEACCG